MTRVVVIGGVVTDFIFRTEVLPGEGIFTRGTIETIPGGKALNQAIACARLGAHTTLISAIGTDHYAGEIRTVLQREHVSFLSPHLGGKVKTDMTLIFLEQGKGRFIGYRHATERLTEAFIENQKAVIRAADIVLVTFDANIHAIQRAIAIAKRAKKHIIINPAPPMNIPMEIINSVRYVVPNSWEAREWVKQIGGLTHTAVENMSDEEIGKVLYNQGANCVIITHGAEGCIVVDSRGSRHFPAILGEGVVSDSTGASDAFCAALAMHLSDQSFSRDGEDQDIAFASAAAALACQHLGAYPSMPNRKDVKRLLRRQRSR